MISAILTYLLVGLVVIVGVSFALGAVMLVLGMATGIVKFLLFTVAPILLIGYVAVRLLSPKGKRLSAAEREWLER